MEETRRNRAKIRAGFLRVIDARNLRAVSEINFKPEQYDATQQVVNTDGETFRLSAKLLDGDGLWVEVAGETITPLTYHLRVNMYAV